MLTEPIFLLNFFKVIGIDFLLFKKSKNQLWLFINFGFCYIDLFLRSACCQVDYVYEILFLFYYLFVFDINKWYTVLFGLVSTSFGTRISVVWVLWTLPLVKKLFEMSYVEVANGNVPSYLVLVQGIMFDKVVCFCFKV